MNREALHIVEGLRRASWSGRKPLSGFLRGGTSVLLVLILAPGLLIAQAHRAASQPSLPPLELLQRAHTLFAEGDYADARRDYLKVLGSFPDNFDVLKDLAYCYYATGLSGYAQAAVYYARAYEINPRSTEVAERLNHCYMALKRYKEAAAVALKMAQLPGAPAEAWKNLAQAYEAADERDKASAAYIDYLQRNPGDLLARSNLARLYGWQKDYRDAMQQYQIVLSSNPNFSPALIGMARLLSWQGQLAKSLDLYNRVLRFEPHNGEAESGKAFVLLWQGHDEEALVLFKQVHRRYPQDAEVSRGLTEAQRAAEQKAFLAAEKSGDTSKIIGYYRQQLAQNPHNLEALRALMVFNANSKHCQESIDFGRQALKLSQEDPEVELALARSLTLCQDYSQAITRYQHYLQSHPKAEGALYELGDTLLRARRSPEAAKVFRKLLGIDAHNLDGQIGLGHALADQGKYDQALAEFNKALQQAPGNYDALQGKGYILFYQNNFEQARSIFQSLEQMNPSDAQNEQALNDISAAEEQARWAALRPAPDAPPQAWRKYYEKRLASYPNNREAMKGLAYVDSELNNVPAAIKGYRRVLALYPGDRDSQMELARLLALDGQYLASINLYQQVLRNDPDDPNVLQKLAGVEDWAGQYHEALEIYQRLLASDPSNTAYLLQIGSLESRLKEYPAARNTFAALLAQQPGNDDARLEIARLDLTQGNLDSSLRNFEILLKHQPKNPMALAGKASIDYRQGRLPQAEASASAAAAAQPKNFDLLMLMANIEHANGHWKQSRQWLQRAAQVNPASPEVIQLRTRLHDEEAVTLHTVASFAREIAPAGIVDLPAIGFANPNTGQSTTIFNEDIFPGRFGEDLSYEDYGTTIGIPWSPSVSSTFTFSSLPTQSRTSPLCSSESFDPANLSQPITRSCAVAPSFFLANFTWRESKFLTFRGGIGAARFGPADFTRAYNLNGNLANLVNRFGYSILPEMGIGGSMAAQAAAALPTSESFSGSNIRPMGFAGATIAPSSKFSVDLNWSHSPAVSLPTPQAMSEHLFQTRYDITLNFLFTRRTELHADFFHAKFSLGTPAPFYDFAFTNPVALQNATLSSNPGTPVSQLWPIFYAPPNPNFSSGQQACPVVTLSDGITKMTPYLINQTPTSLLCALGQVTDGISTSSDWGNGVNLTFTQNLVQRTRFSLDAGYRGLIYGYSQARETVDLGFFHPAFYQNQMLTGRVYGKLFGPVGYDLYGGIGIQQTDHGRAITRSGIVTPAFTIKLNHTTTLGISYTHYNSAQTLGPLRGNAFSLTTDSRF